MSNFWLDLKRPIIGLSPMDGVTDAPMRSIVAKYGKPSVLMTEFVAVEGIAAGATKIMREFDYDEIQRPIVAQIFGKEPRAFRVTAYVVAALGFDGVDINMGCPAKNVEQHGSGAALIQTPELAAEIVAQTKLGVEDFVNGKTFEEVGVPRKVAAIVKADSRYEIAKANPKLIPVSVKTRIGYDKPVTEEWIGHLLKQDLANISLHGRTLKQYYGGLADWEEIGKAAKLVRESGRQTSILGNGDIKSLEQAKELIGKYQLDGVLIGRAAMGEPGIFDPNFQFQISNFQTRRGIAIEHAKLFEKFFGVGNFLPMRKHLAWYASGFPGAAELRSKLVLANSSQEVEEIWDLKE